MRKGPSGRRLVLLGTCPRAVVLCVLCALSGFAAAGGRCCLAPVRVPWLWPAACLSGVYRRPAWCAAPRPVRSLSVLWSAFPTLWCLSQPRGLAPPALLGGCAGHAEAGREPGSLCLPLAPAEVGTLGSLRVVPVRGPAMGLSLAGPSGVGLGLRALRWFGCVDPVTDASGFPYRPSFDGGLGLCTGPVSCGRQHLPLLVGGRHARVPCVCACARPSWPGWAGRPPGRVLVRLTFFFGRFVFLLCLAPSGLGLPPSWSLVCPPPLLVAFFFFSPLLFSACPLCPLLSLVSGPGCRGPWRCVLFVSLASLSPPLCCPPGRWLLSGGCRPPPPLPLLCLALFVAAARCLAFVVFFVFLLLFAPPLSLAFFWLPAPGALGLGAVLRNFFPFLFASRLSARRALSPLLCLPLGRWLLLGYCCPPPPSPFVSRGFRCCRSVACFFFSSSCVRPRWLWLSLVSGPGCPGPWRRVLFVLWASRCRALRALLPRLCAPPCRWLLPGGCCPPPPFCVSRFLSLPLGALFFFFFPALCAPVVSGFLWFSAPGALGLGAVRCLLCWPPASRLSVRSRLIRASRLAVGCSLVAAAPPPLLFLAVFVAAARCCVPRGVLCCVSLGAVLRHAAARFAAQCCAVVCCVVLLRSFGAAACCAMPSGAARLPGALCFAAPCFAVFPRAVCSVLCVFCRGVVVCAVVRRSALCCGCPGVLCCAFPVLSALCGAVLRCTGALALCCSCGACCCLRLVLWCAAVCGAVSFGVLWCGAGSGGPWLSADGVSRCPCPCLAARSAALWLVWFAVVPCFPVPCSVVLCCRAVLCCFALLSCCGAVGACFALLCPVVLCCVVLLVGCAVFCPVVVKHFRWG